MQEKQLTIMIQLNFFMNSYQQPRFIVRLEMKKLVQFLYLLTVIIIISGCATGRHTVPVENPDYRVKSDKSLVIFMRPSNFGAAISSAIFELKENKTTEEELIGIIGPNEKIAYYTNPGKNKRFMVISENADFMDANLDAGKAYYAIVTPRMGLWRARFSLHPFKQVSGEPEFQLDSKKLVDWLNECKFVNPNEESYVWAKENADSINDKKISYLQKWEEMLEEDKQWRRLEPNDGLSNPL